MRRVCTNGISRLCGNGIMDSLNLSFSVPILPFLVYFSQSSSITYASQIRSRFSFPLFLFTELIYKCCNIDADDDDDGGSGCHYGALASPFAIHSKIQFVVHYSVNVYIVDTHELEKL